MLLSPLPTAVGVIRVAPVAASTSVPDLAGIAVAGNPAAVAFAKNIQRPQFTSIKEDLFFFKRDWCKYVRQLGGKTATFGVGIG